MRPNVFELLDKINRIAQKPDFPAISKIEKDLLKHYLREMYELVDEDIAVVTTVPDLSQTSHKPPIPKIIVEEKAPEVVVEQPVKQITPEPVKEVIKEIVAEPVVMEPVQEVTHETIQPEQLVTNKQVEEEPTPVNHPKFITREELLSKTHEVDTVSVKATVNDMVKPYQTLNERIKGSGKEIHKVLSLKPLKDMIDLNKRFVLVNELFKGDSAAFSKAVQDIDSFENYDDAKRYVQNGLASQFNWDATSQTVRMFVKMVKQRFGEE